LSTTRESEIVAFISEAYDTLFRSILKDGRRRAPERPSAKKKSHTEVTKVRGGHKGYLKVFRIEGTPETFPTFSDLCDLCVTLHRPLIG